MNAIACPGLPRRYTSSEKKFHPTVQKFVSSNDNRSFFISLGNDIGKIICSLLMRENNLFHR